MITTRINKGNLVNLVRRLCSDNKNKVLVAVKLEENCVEKLDDEMKSEEILELPPEPDNCCMSGCPNCVWVQYAQELTALYQRCGSTNSGEKAKMIILEKIKDPSMQVFLKMELKIVE